MCVCVYVCVVHTFVNVAKYNCIIIAISVIFKGLPA